MRMPFPAKTANVLTTISPPLKRRLFLPDASKRILAFPTDIYPQHVILNTHPSHPLSLSCPPQSSKSPPGSKIMLGGRKVRVLWPLNSPKSLSMGSLSTRRRLMPRWVLIQSFSAHDPATKSFIPSSPVADNPLITPPGEELPLTSAVDGNSPNPPIQSRRQDTDRNVEVQPIVDWR